MEIIIFIVLIVILWKIWNNPNLMWIYIMMYLMFGGILLDILCIRLLLSNENLNQIIGGLTIIVNILLIIIMILPWFLLKKHLKNMFKILYYYINKHKILKYGENQKAIIEEVVKDNITYGYDESYYLIVNLNNEKIRSFYFTHNSKKEKIRITKSKITIIQNNIKEEKQECDDEKTTVYKVGDEIDVIVYNNWKYVKLYNME